MDDRENESNNLSKMYSCQYCGLMITNKWNLTIHLRIHEKNLPYKCSVCSKGFNSTTTLKRHKESHGGSIYACNKCPSRFNCGSSLRYHLKTKHENADSTYTCKVCHQVFKVLTDYHLHKRTHIEDTGLFDCSYCSKSFSTAEFKSKHEDKNHYYLKKSNDCKLGKNKTNCPKKVLGVGPQQLVYENKCTLCGYSVKSRRDFKDHILSRHVSLNKENQYECSHCSYVTSVAKAYQGILNHLTMHSKVKPFKCDKCDYSSVRPNDLGDHITNMHSNDFKYECEICKRKFKVLKNLTQHVKIHQVRIKKYQCCFCNKSYHRRSYLLIHKETHLGIKYLCHYCNKTFNNYCIFVMHKTNSCSELLNSSKNLRVTCDPIEKMSKSYFKGGFYLYECFACGRISQSIQGASCCQSYLESKKLSSCP